MAAVRILGSLQSSSHYHRSSKVHDEGEPGAKVKLLWLSQGDAEETVQSFVQRAEVALFDAHSPRGGFCVSCAPRQWMQGAEAI